MIFRAPAPIMGCDWNKAVFLAGSIEMCEAEHWQITVAHQLNDAGLDVLDPRRLDWDDSWVQSINNKQFREQVEWELLGLEMAQFRIFNFLPGTKSPVTMFEFGLATGSFTDSVVVCPEGFWRKGNIDIVCAKYGIPQVKTLDEAVKLAIEEVNHAQELLKLYDSLEKTM